MNGQKSTGKQRASRIPLDYYKHGDRVSGRKAFWTRLALLATLGWTVLLFPACLLPGVKTSPIGMERFSHGEVCQVHRGIEHECSACHVNFPMLGGRTELVDGEKGGRSTFAGDLKCVQCHLGEKKGEDKFVASLAIHHPTMKAEMTPNCGTCHADHKGADRDLKRVADRNCTNCHSNIQNSLASGTSRYGDVSSFATQHPQFRSIEKGDPSKIKFNHKYHMTSGIVLYQGGKEFTLADIPDELRDRYRKKDQPKADTPEQRNKVDRGYAVRLDCADCHRPSTRDDLAWEGSSPVADVENKDKSREAFAARRAKRDWDGSEGVLKPPQRPGAYLAPVRFEDHCKACHPITLDRKENALPHPGQLTRASGKPFDLNEYLDQQVVPKLETPGRTVEVPFTLPGARPPQTGSPRREPLLQGLLAEKEPQKRREGLRGAARHLLFSQNRTCGECHVSDTGADLSPGTMKIAQPAIPDIWLAHARFDHGKHEAKGINCRECHADAYAYKDDARKEWDERGVRASSAKIRKGAEDVMIPNLANCQQCHSPKPTDEASRRGVTAKHDCTECHSYHHGMPPGKGGNQRAEACPEPRGRRADHALLRGLGR